MTTGLYPGGREGWGAEGWLPPALQEQGAGTWKGTMMEKDSKESQGAVCMGSAIPGDMEPLPAAETDP